MFSLFTKQPDNYTAFVNTAEHSIAVASGKTLLTAALEQGLQWPHRCKVGSCGTCKCKIVSGKVKPLIDFIYVLDQTAIDDGYVLACQSELKSDIEVAVELPVLEEII